MVCGQQRAARSQRPAVPLEAHPCDPTSSLKPPLHTPKAGDQSLTMWPLGLSQIPAMP